MLRYIVMVLTDYEAEQERLREGITKTKDFKYPPVIPIIYYEGSDNWTTAHNFKDRVHLSDILGDYPQEYLKNLEDNTPEYLLKLISKIISVLLYRINIPQQEVESFTDQIMRREFSMLFDSFEAYDVQAVRKESLEDFRSKINKKK